MTAGYYVYVNDIGTGEPGWRGSDGTTVAYPAGPGGTPGVTRPYFGSCPTTSGGGAAAVVSKFGVGSSVRIFFNSGDLTQRPSIPAGVSILHVSYKVTEANILNGSQDANLIDLINWMRPGWILTLNHERDNDGISGSAITDWKNMQNYLYDIKQATKPSVFTAPVFVGGTLASYTSNATRDTWCTGISGDLFGIDCDGVHISSTEANYNRISYEDELDNCETYMRHPTNTGFKAITVGEHMTARVNPPDPTGSIRAAWFQRETQRMVDHGCYAVMAYDFNFGTHNTSTNFNEMPTGSPELTLWRSLVANNPATPRT